jgi:NAD(P)H-hydrate epimerase
MDQFGLPSMILMERAGQAVFDAMKLLLPEGGVIVVVCGKGNNGGDGFVLARLAVESGFAVEVLVTAHEDELREECRQQMLQARSRGICPIYCDDARWPRRLEALGTKDLVVDAVLGTGASGDLSGCAREAIEAINRSGVPVLSVDVPSGIDTDTGKELGTSVWALRTVTMGLPKPCLFQGIGLEHSGFWSVANIGYPGELLREPTGVRLIDHAWVLNLMPERLRSSHKGNNGHVLIVAGSDRLRGAAALAAKAALRSGAGLVTVAGIESVCQTVLAHAPEATLIPLPSFDGCIAPSAAEIVLQNQHRYTSTLFGPGLTHDEPVTEFLSRIWPRWETPSVLDADALNAVSQGLDLPPCDAVLTPHPGEMSRLLRCTIAEVQADRFQTTREAVAKFGKAIILKGAYSLAGAPDEPLNVNSTGNSGMASAGMGDVLAGIVSTLLAQELTPYEAASVGMFWHGLAGDLCAEEIGHIGFVARDVAKAIPVARAKLSSLASHPSMPAALPKASNTASPILPLTQTG